MHRNAAAAKTTRAKRTTPKAAPVDVSLVPEEGMALARELAGKTRRIVVLSASPGHGEVLITNQPA